MRDSGEAEEEVARREDDGFATRLRVVTAAVEDVSERVVESDPGIVEIPAGILVNRGVTEATKRA